MKQHTLISIRITLALLVITCGLYPLLVWGIGQAAFRDGANGSLITRNGKVIGSALIAQNFTDAKYFHPRPSAAGSDGYDPSASGGTNWGMTSKKLLDAIAGRTATYADVTPSGGKPAGGIPADAVTASCSGVDPDISPANAYAQAPRVAKANGIALAQVTALIDRHTVGRFAGVFGEPRVNVLQLNLALAPALARISHTVSSRGDEEGPGCEARDEFSRRGVVDTTLRSETSCNEADRPPFASAVRPRQDQPADAIGDLQRHFEQEVTERTERAGLDSSVLSVCSCLSLFFLPTGRDGVRDGEEASHR